MKHALIVFGLPASLPHLSLFLTPLRPVATDPAGAPSDRRRFSQSALEAYFGRRPALRFQPPLEVLHANFVLNHGMPDNDRDRRLAAAYIVYPIVLAKHPKALSHGFIK